jgi:DNA-binding response OmpR family regulator
MVETTWGQYTQKPGRPRASVGPEIGGRDVRAVHDGVTGLAAAASFRPDVARLDLGPPEANGYDLARRIRGHEWGKSVVVIAVTGWPQEDDRRRTREAGFVHPLVRTVDLDALHALFARTATAAPAPDRLASV